MTWRKWLVRGLVFTALGGIALAAVLYQAWTNPAATRRQLLDRLGAQFPGALVSVESARLRLLGGIAVHDLRMARRDELDKTDFLYVPSAVIYHDKEHLLHGTLAIDRIELQRPRLRLVRGLDGRYNLSGLCAPPNLQQRMPTLVVRQGTLLFEDRRWPGTPLLEIKDADVTVVNDPMLSVTLEGSGQTDVAGPVRVRASFHRATGEASARFELPGVPVGPALVQRLSGPLPDVARHLRHLSARGQVAGRLTYYPSAARPLSYEARCRLSGGEFSHALLPETLRDIELSCRCVNGDVSLDEATARAGTARLRLNRLELTLPSETPACLEDIIQEIDGQVFHLPVTPELLERLPSVCQEIACDYKPAGPASLTYTFRRTGTAQWTRHWIFQPEGMRGVYRLFKYPFDHVTGSIEVDTNSEHNSQTEIHLTGLAGTSPVALDGTVHGPPGSPAVDLTVRGDNLLLDDRVYEALPEASKKVAVQFLPERSRRLGLKAQPAGLASFKVLLRRKPGEEYCSPHYFVSFQRCQAEYDLFPYPQENVTGLLEIHPDHWECRFRSTHKQGEIRIAARSYLAPGPDASRGAAPTGLVRHEREERVRVAVEGRNILLDEEFENALTPRGGEGRAALQSTWKALSLRGRMNFGAEVIDSPSQPQDLDVGVSVQGCTMQPQFFKYALDDVSARVRYARGMVHVYDVQGKHGPTALRLRHGLIRLKPGGGFTAWLDSIRGGGLVANDDFLEALPLPLRQGLTRLELQTPFDVDANLLVLDTDQPGGPLKVWWNGGMALRGAAAQAGVALAGVDGEIYCEGHYDGQQLQGLLGDVLLRKAVVLGQPLNRVHCLLRVSRDSPNALELHNLKADLFGGSLGGQGRIEFGPELKYEMFLTALQVKLQEFGRHNLGTGAQLEGPARASLHVKGEGPGLSGLRGSGLIEVTNGKMYRLPVLLDLLKWLGLRVPDRTAFEQAHMDFDLQGSRLAINHLDLYGSAISLRGQGTVDLDGSNVNLDFNADWGRMPELLPPGLGDLSRAISDQVLKIKMRGNLGKPGSLRFEKELVPAVVGPIKRALGGTP